MPFDPFLDNRRRRLLVSSWIRFRRWEYWPPWIFYLPVAMYLVWLMLRYRSIMLFTAANPGIEAGGVVGESKIDILRGLAPAGHRVATSELIVATLARGERQHRAEQFLARAGIGLPVVLKPNAGQRGSGVVVARTASQLTACLDATTVDTVIQSFVPGEEFGVFYARLPEQDRGRVISITRKRLPEVVGNGAHTLEQLILSAPHTIGMARFHLRQQAHRLSLVPGPGEAVSLGDCGSHCRGAVFSDGSPLLTDALAEAVDEVAQAFEGFYFGRFDVRTPSAEAFQRGEFTVIELNGVTSEATHIYDARMSLWAAYATLFAQWRLAFLVGRENVARGARPASIRQVVRLALKYRALAKGHLRPLTA